MVNPEWHQLFPEAEVIFQEPSASDHSPILVHLGLQLHIRRPPFRFFSYWIEHPQFKNVVASAWQASRVGSPMFCLAQKMKGLKSALKNLNRTEFSNISARTKDAREALMQIQRQLLQQQGDDELKFREKQALDRLLFFSKAEEAFHKQKSRISWIKEGDSNSKIFHHDVKARFNRNKVMSILLENGDRTHEPAAIHAATVRHIETLFNGVSDFSEHPLPLNLFISKSISSHQAAALVRPVTPAEIKEVFFRMNPDKALGPDGFSAVFYQKTWHLVGSKVTHASSAQGDY